MARLRLRQRLRGRCDGRIERQGGTYRTSRFVVPVMQIRPALLGVRDRTRFFASESERRAKDPQLPNDSEDCCEHLQLP